MQRAKFSPCGKEVKARVNLSPLQKLKGHQRGKVMLHLLVSDSLSLNIGHRRKTRSWISTFGLFRYGHSYSSPNWASLCFLFSFPPEDSTAPAQHLDPIIPGTVAPMHSHNNQGNQKILP